MTASQHTSRISNVTLAPVPLAVLLAATLLGGVGLGAVINMQAETLKSGSAAVQPASAFDAVEFRAGERAPLPASFDSSSFRAQERAPLVQPATGPLSTEHRDRIGGP
jgi:hypothetical protein